MAISIEYPALITDLADVYAAEGPIPVAAWVVIRHQHRSGPTWVVRGDAGEALTVAGLFPLGDGAEAWFAVAPAAAKHMLAVIRLLRLTLDAVPYGAIQTVIATDAGRRIARALGFRPIPARNDLEVWEFGRWAV